MPQGDRRSHGSRAAKLVCGGRVLDAAGVATSSPAIMRRVATMADASSDETFAPILY